MSEPSTLSMLKDYFELANILLAPVLWVLVKIHSTISDMDKRLIKVETLQGVEWDATATQRLPVMKRRKDDYEA